MKTKLFFILCLVALQSFAQGQLPNSLDFLRKERGLSQTLKEEDDLRTLQKRQQARRFRHTAPEFTWDKTRPNANFNNHTKQHAKPKKQTQIFQSDELVQLFDSIDLWQWVKANNNWASNPIYRAKSFIYDTRNNLLSVLYVNPNSVPGRNGEKSIWTYDANNNKLSELYERWNPSTQAWVNISKYTWTYDANSNKLSELREDWNNGTQAWVNSRKYSWTYDANNNRLSESEQFWNTNTQTWVNYERHTWTYDSNKLSSELEEFWSTSFWEDRKRITYTYTNNNLTSELHSNWQWNSQRQATIWMDQYQYTFLYDVNNNQLSEFRKFWIFDSEVWRNDLKTTRTYDANNNLLSELREEWNISTQAYVNDYKLTSTYDANNNQLSQLYELWNNSTQVWVNDTKRTWTYDANNFRTSQAFFRFNSNNMVENGDSTHYYFRTAAVGIKDLISHEQRINVYPNPASGAIHVAFLASSPEPVALSLRNALGKVVYAETLPASNERIKTNIQVADLPPGLYILFAKGKRWINTEKVMVE